MTSLVGVVEDPAIVTKVSKNTSTLETRLMSACFVTAQTLRMPHRVRLENEALFFLHLFLTKKEAKHLWYRKTVQSSLVLVLISPISLPHLTQF